MRQFKELENHLSNIIQNVAHSATVASIDFIPNPTWQVKLRTLSKLALYCSIRSKRSEPKAHRIEDSMPNSGASNTKIDKIGNMLLLEDNI